jgi:hypothetical protein
MTLLADIEAFLTTHQMAPSRFGQLALNDRHFVRNLNRDPPRRLWPETEQRVRRFMATYKPEQAAA